MFEFKRMKLIVMIGIIFLTASCTPSEQGAYQNPAIKISGGAHAECSYLTKDHKGNPVVVWTEGNKETKEVFLYYAVSVDKGKTFGEAIKVESSKGTVFHAESMNKVAFKSDGTVIAVFEKKAPTKENQYAGYIFYTQSFDNGKTWTDSRHLHTDTSAGISRSFFDLTLLPDGEVGAIWLDGRMRLGEKGSSVFYASTKGKEGFTTDKQIGETICQCCRTDLYTDAGGKLHAVFRDIINDSIRDMVHVVSVDTGKTFSEPVRISADNWVIKGCPHTGPDMTSNNAGLHFTWYTAGGKPGVYYCNSSDNGKTYKERELVSNDARHPRIASFNEKVMIVWDEMVRKDTIYYPRIGFQVRNEGSVLKYYLSEENKSSDFPQLLSIANESVLVSWTQRDNKGCEVVYKVIRQK